MEQGRNQSCPSCLVGIGVRVCPQALPERGLQKESTKAKELPRNLEPPEHEPQSRKPAAALDSSAGVLAVPPSSRPRAPSAELGRTVLRFSGSGDKSWVGLCKGAALCCQMRGQGKVRKCPKFDTHSPPPSHLPHEEKERFYVPAQLWGPPGSGLSGYFLALSQPPAPQKHIL